MCRNIKVLYNFDPPVTQNEIHEASLQFIRKISGYTKPSQVNEAAFNKAVQDVSVAAHQLLSTLTTTAPTRDRETEHKKAHERALKRFGTS